jgi:hypothetical protein
MIFWDMETKQQRRTIKIGSSSSQVISDGVWWIEPMSDLIIAGFEVPS